jgi:hypothetical protein
MSLPIKPFSLKEVRRQIKNLNPRKAPGYDLITSVILKLLPKKGLVLLTTIYNSMFRLTHFPLIWKFTQIIMVPEPGKPINEVSSHRPISPLPTPSKLFEKLLLSRMRIDIDLPTVTPDFQFGFRKTSIAFKSIGAGRFSTHVSTF